MLRSAYCLAVVLASCALSNAGVVPQGEDLRPQSSSRRRHALARQRCGWTEESVLEDYGRVGLLRIGSMGCLVWFTPEGTAPYRELISGATPTRMVDLPGEPLPAVVLQSPGPPKLDLELVRPMVGSQSIALVSPSTTVTLVGAQAPCDHVSVRGLRCPDALWTEEITCVGEQTVRTYRRWPPGTFGAYQTQPSPPSCATSGGSTWFESHVSAKPVPSLAPSSGVTPPAAPEPPAASASKFLGAFPSRVRGVRAFAAFEVGRSDLDGGLERDLDLYELPAEGAWRRWASTTLRRKAAPEHLGREGSEASDRSRDGACRESAVLSLEGTLTTVSCLDEQRVEAVVDRASALPPPRLAEELQSSRLRCDAFRSVSVCVEAADDGSAVGWLVDSRHAPPWTRGLPELRRLRLLDGPFFEAERIRFVGRDVADDSVRWVEVGIPSSSSDRTGQRALEPVLADGGWVTGVWKLKSGARFLTRNVCSEWGASLPGAVIFPPSKGAGPTVLAVDSGPAIDLGRHLLVWSERQVGGDGDPDAPVDLPEGATSFEATGNGAYVVHRVSAVDLVTRTMRHLPWGTHSPRTAGAGRYVVYARALEGNAPPKFAVAEASRHELATWDLQTGRTRVLGVSSGPVVGRVDAAEVRVLLREGARAKVVAVNGTTGAVRELVGATELVDSPVQSPLSPGSETAASAPRPRFWQTLAGEAVLVPRAGDRLPQTGTCGSPSYHWFDGLFVSDEGLFAWPDDLELLDFARPPDGRPAARPAPTTRRGPAGTVER